MFTSLYGLRIELLPGWRDITEYSFEARGYPLFKLVFVRQRLLPDQVDAWLLDIQTNLPDELAAGPIVDYDNPILQIRGFDATHSVGGELEGTSFIVVSFPESAIIVQPRWRGEGKDQLEELLRSLRPQSASASNAPLAPALLRFAVLGLTFESVVPFDEPASFAFENATGRGHLWCRKRPRERAFEEPQWTTRFDIGLDPLLAPNVVHAGPVVSSHLLPPELTGPAFEQVLWTTTASVEGSLHPLAWGEARTDCEGEPLRIWFADEAADDEALSTWRSILLSARRE